MSAGERLPGTPVPGHIWDGYEGIKIAGDTWGNPNNPVSYTHLTLPTSDLV